MQFWSRWKQWWSLWLFGDVCDCSIICSASLTIFFFFYISQTRVKNKRGAFMLQARSCQLCQSILITYKQLHGVVTEHMLSLNRLLHRQSFWAVIIGVSDSCRQWSSDADHISGCHGSVVIAALELPSACRVASFHRNVRSRLSGSQGISANWWIFPLFFTGF